MQLPSEPVRVDQQALAAFCQRHGVRELAVFGSVARGDFCPESDVDIMLDFLPGHGFTFENTPIIIAELKSLFGRDVDVVEKGRIRNRFRRASIMRDQKVLYAA